jgi:hypothetical protein
VDHLVIVRITIEVYCNNKIDLLCWFVDFRKTFDIVPRISLWNRLEMIKVCFESRDTMKRLYENVFSKLRNIEGWSKEITYNNWVKQGCPLSATLFGIYIDK